MLLDPKKTPMLSRMQYKCKNPACPACSKNNPDPKEKK